LIVSLLGEGESIILWPVRWGFLPQHALPPPLIAAIDIAAWPGLAIYYRHGQEGRFIAKSGNSLCRGKSKFFYDDVMQLLSIAPPFFSSLLFLQPSVW
jgi:hypothetical protein